MTAITNRRTSASDRSAASVAPKSAAAEPQLISEASGYASDTTPMSDPRYVFLDLNHWIYLAKAYQGRPQRPAHKELLASLLAAVNRDEVRLPINCLHLIELARSTE
jgi:hypothetical protein